MGNSPNWSYGYVPTASEWNISFSSKQDELDLSTAAVVALRTGPNISSGFVGLSATGAQMLLATLGATQGDLLYCGASGWTALPPGTSGYALKSQGAGANPVWALMGAGTVTSVALSAGTTGLSFTGGPITTNGTITAGGTLAIANGGTGAGDTAAARISLGLAIGTNVQAWDADIDALAALSSTGIAARTAANTWAQRTITGTTSRITVGNGDGVSGNPTIDVGADVYVSGGTDVAVADGGTGASTAAGALTNLGISVRSRNILINGDTRFDQRHGGAAQTITAGAALAYTVDRWYAYCTGANVTGQRIAGTAPSQYRYRFTGASSVTGIGFAQRIEAANSFYLAGETATLSVELANTVLTAVTWTAYYANSTDTFGTVASPTRTQIATGTFTVNSTVARYSAPISVSASATTGIEIVLSVGAQTSGTWTIGAVQLAKGAGVTEFEYSDVQYTLNKCLRYYEKSYDMAVTPGTVDSNGCWMSVAINSADFNDFGRLEWRARKRATPTVTVYSAGTGTAGKSYQQGATDVTCTVTWVGECGAHLVLSGATGSQYQQLHWTCDAEL